ncbi:flippase-like domain-containing protein [Candidatus Woesearchaeota archaeon]|nr:flippase-like domain-containing protein [Candidatus Woesearchaeota archaeon]
MKKTLAANFLSFVIGFALFALVIKLAGLENVLGAVKGFYLLYFVPFIVVSGALFWAATYRWKIVLSGEGVNVPFWTLLKYKLVVFSINYFTPAARLGGEPLKVLLLQKQRVKSSKSFASIVVDNFLGMGFDAIVAAIILIAIVFTTTSFTSHVKELFLMTGLSSLALVASIYLVLVKKKKSVFSYLLETAGRLTGTSKHEFFMVLHEKVSRAEFYMREILAKRPKQVFLALFYSSLSWPLTLLQYKLALLTIGFNASLVQILLSVVVVSFTALMPIPAALGVQEAGQFSAFKLFSANPYTGIALSLVLRIKDLILVLLSFLFISSEGIEVFRIANKKIARAINGINNKRNSRKKRKSKKSKK